MSTSLTLDQDVAVALERLRKRQDISLREAANQLLREHLRALGDTGPSSGIFQTQSVDLGQCLIGDLVDISSALAIAEDEDFS